MARHALLKPIFAQDKIILEFSLKGLLAEVQAYNRIVLSCHRKNPRETWPLVVVVNERAFLKYVYRELLKAELPGVKDLVTSFACRVHEIVEAAHGRKGGLRERQPTRQELASDQRSVLG